MQSSDRYITQAENYKGYTINIVQDTDPMNPRTEWDNLGTMVCWHSRYHLGDMDGNNPISKDYQEADYLFAEIAGIDRDSDYCMGIYDKQGHKALSQYLYNAACKKAIILPLYLYDHSGITMSTSKFSCTWDSGCVGYIYITLDKVRKEYNWKTITKTRRNKVVQYLTGEVENYDQYLTGDVWGFEVCAKDSECPIDSCWGFYGDEGIKDALVQAMQSVDGTIKERIHKHIAQVKTWIKNKVPLGNRKPLQLVA